MSRFVEVSACNITDPELLVSALEQIGFTRDQIEVHEKPQTLYGYRGDARKEKANVIIRRKYVGGAANDVGWRFTESGAVEVISEFDRENRFAASTCNQLRQEYAALAVERMATKSGLRVERERLKTGQVRVMVSGYR